MDESDLVWDRAVFCGTSVSHGTGKSYVVMSRLMRDIAVSHGTEQSHVEQMRLNC